MATDIDLSDPRPWVARGPRLQWLDVRRREEVKDGFASVRPDLVLHLAAETSLEISDTDPDHAYLTNTVATKYVALQARAAGIPMVYISTAGVFDGTKDGAYTEFDRPNPVNTYGASKYEGELIVASTVEEHYIIRAGWMVGGGAAKDHKFVVPDRQPAARRGADHLRGHRQARHADLHPGVRPLPDGPAGLGAVRALPHGLRRRGQPLRRGRPDPAGAGPDDVELVGVGSDHFAEEFFSVRPDSEIMRNMVLDLQGMNTMPDWPEAIASYLHAEFAELIDRDVRVA